MADRLIHSRTLAEIAAAIRLKTDSEEAMSPGQMARQILLAGCGVPGYHDLEAMEVLDKLRNLRSAGGNLLVCGVMADSHVHVGTDYEALSKVSARHGAYALEAVGRVAGCTFLANLGDNCWSGNLDDADDYAAAQYLNGCIAGIFGHMRSYRLVGECDHSADPEKAYSLNGVYNTFDVSAPTARRGFGYTDYPVQRVRLIVLNTSDCSSAGYGMSYEQKDFLMKALDLSGKADCAQWQILILSHYPLDWPDDSICSTAADVNAILSAYVAGSAVEITVDTAAAAAEGEDAAAFGSSLAYDYAGKNSARVIANIHGHIHGNCYGTMAGSGILRITTPNTCFYQDEKYAAGQYAADVTYPKTEFSAEDTAVTFYALDLDNHVIHSIAYGAGTDRVMGY